MLIIGGTGDLSRRHLLPALTRLLAKGELPEGFSLILTGLEPMSVQECRDLLARELSEHALHHPAEARRSLVERTSYVQADVRDPDALRAAPVTEPVLVYFATPPEAVPAALTALAHAEIHRAPARLVFDKPFGLDQRSAQELNERVRELADARQVFRIDHFLYHHAVQQLVRARVQSDPLSLVDLLPVTDVEIVWDETRASQAASPFYAGAMRDMIQSHLLQLAAVLTMQSPESLTHSHFARCRLEALKAITAVADPSSPPRGSEPETVAVLPLRSQLPRWRGVRFLLRAANGVGESRRHIELRFARPGQAQPGFIRLEVLAGILALGARGTRTAPMEFEISNDAETASTRLLRAMLHGDDTFALDPREPVEAWRIVEPVLRPVQDGTA